MVAGRLQNSGMLINRVYGDAGRFAEKLAGERFAALVSAENLIRVEEVTDSSKLEE